MPADAVHDAQTPRFGPHGVRTSAPTPPVYVEIGKDYQLPNVPVGASPQPQPQTAYQTRTTSLTAGAAPAAQNKAQIVGGGIGGVYQVPYFRLPYYGYQPTFIY